MPCIDLHTHRPTGLPNRLEVQSIRYGQEPEVAAAYCTVGLHPWFLEASALEDGLAWLRARAAQPGVVAVGESGLDKAVETNWDVQVAVFHEHVLLSEAMQKPLIIHCVRAYSEIASLKKQWKPVQPWIIHGFNKGRAQADILRGVGCLLSFGHALLSPRNHSAEVLATLPDDAFFLETDDSGLSIEVIYRSAAALRGVSEEALTAVLEQRFKELFLPQNHI